MASLKDTTITGGLSVSGTTNITGATQHNSNITLYSSSGDSPALFFQRGTTSDTLNDYKIYDTSGYLTIKQSGNSGTSGFTQVAQLTNQGTFTVSTPPASDTTPSTTAWISPTDSAIKIATDATIASGDKLVIRDSSDSNKLRSSSITFGSSTTTYLRNDGTWGTPSGGGGGGVTPSDIVVKGYDNEGETVLYSGNLGSGLAVIEPLILDDSAVSELAIEHKNSGVTAGTYAAQAYDSSMTGTSDSYEFPTITVDSAGHITSASNYGIYIPTAINSSGLTPAIGFMTYAQANNLRYGLDYYYPHVFSGTSGSFFTMSAGTSSTSVSMSIYPGSQVNNSSIDHTGSTLLGNVGSYRVIGVNAYLRSLNTGTTEPVWVDWSSTSPAYNYSTSKYDCTVTVSTANSVPQGYAIDFKILYSVYVTH